MSAATQAAVQIDPAVVAEQAVKQLAFGSPSIEMAPPDGSPQLVSVATWLCLDPGTWQTLTATANAPATATPAKVVWDIGNGDSVTCDGPGTPYSASDPNATTECTRYFGADVKHVREGPIDLAEPGSTRPQSTGTSASSSPRRPNRSPAMPNALRAWLVEEGRYFTSHRFIERPPASWVTVPD